MAITDNTQVEVNLTRLVGARRRDHETSRLLRADRRGLLRPEGRDDVAAGRELSAALMDAPWPIRLGWVRIAELGLGMLFVIAGVVKLSGMALHGRALREPRLRTVAALRARRSSSSQGALLLIVGHMEYLAALALAVIMVGATAASIIVFDRSPIPPALTFIALLVLAWKHHPSDEIDVGR